ncbi:hypothetical protein EB796_023516 [Bugula neritina]|uniref:Uncharacterized protein n=1 Tax=Bugula neritina TaxID=10212 RepID=A0A7J7IXC7_BUGNE|nr:hypothetical protein EB796_023516 [Bugula neritina]
MNVLTVKLPEGITCETCVLQWKYCEISTGRKSFYGNLLIDISLKCWCNLLAQYTTLKPTTNKIQTGGKTRCYAKKSEFNNWCNDRCAMENCNPSYCWCDDNPVLPTKKVCEGSYKDWCESNCNHIPSYCTPCKDVQFDHRV